MLVPTYNLLCQVSGVSSTLSGELLYKCVSSDNLHHQYQHSYHRGQSRLPSLVEEQVSLLLMMMMVIMMMMMMMLQATLTRPPPRHCAPSPGHVSSTLRRKRSQSLADLHMSFNGRDTEVMSVLLFVIVLSKNLLP